jgi:phosphinothricin acetyltransferase
MQIRLAVPEDASEILAIYKQYCQRPVTFELEAPGLQEMERRIRETLVNYPWIVAVEENQILGYAYACSFRTRKAWQWTVETSVYVANDAHQQGIGSALYEKLLSMLTAQGFVSAIASITLPNPASLKIHERFKFQNIGILKNAGYKCNSWHDVAFLKRTLNSPKLEPAEPRGLAEVAGLAL